MCSGGEARLQGAQDLAVRVVEQHSVVGRVEDPPKPLELAQVQRPAEVGGPLKGVERGEAVQHLPHGEGAGVDASTRHTLVLL